MEIVRIKKVSVIGHYAYDMEYLDGQTVKTKVLSKELDKQFGEDNVLKIDTHGGIKTLICHITLNMRALRQVDVS